MSSVEATINGPCSGPWQMTDTLNLLKVYCLKHEFKCPGFINDHRMCLVGVSEREPAADGSELTQGEILCSGAGSEPSEGGSSCLPLGTPTCQ